MSNYTAYHLADNLPIFWQLLFIHKHTVASHHSFMLVIKFFCKKIVNNFNVFHVELRKAFFKPGMRRYVINAICNVHVGHYNAWQ